MGFLGVSLAQPSPAEMAIEFETFNMPYNRVIPWGLDPDSWVMVEGIILKHSKGFQMDFTCGQFYGASIPLRFKLSFESSPSLSTTLTLNSFANRKWGKEIQTAARLRPGQRFKIHFIITSKAFKVTENGVFLCEFDHRLPPKAIRFLEMDGDLKLEKMAFSWERNN